MKPSITILNTGYIRFEYIGSSELNRLIKAGEAKRHGRHTITVPFAQYEWLAKDIAAHLKLAITYE